MSTLLKLVTIRLPRNPLHDPAHKVVGKCLFSESCTDSTGEHHTGVMTTSELIKLEADGSTHITRIEDI